MQLTITLNDELAHRLESQARSQDVPVERWAVLILSQATDQPQEFATWAKVNQRRFALIEKRYSSGLSEEEQHELNGLQDAVDKLLQPCDDQMLEMLEPYEALVERLSKVSDG